MRKFLLSAFLGALLYGLAGAQNTSNCSCNNHQKTKEEQNPVTRCGTDKAMNDHFKRSPKSQKEAYNFEAYSKAWSLKKMGKANGSVTIPVVFHVFGQRYNGNKKVNDAIVIDALKKLNEDFQGITDDWNSVSPLFDPIKKSMDITFALAKIDPSGNPCTGINYYAEEKGFGNDYGYEDRIQLYAWDNYKYMNVYVMYDLYDDGDCCNSGVAWYPTTDMSDNNLARVVYNGSYLGTNTDENFRRVLTHEFGHWLNLKHTFENGCEDPGDGVDDTPPTTVNSGSCNLSVEKCLGAGIPNGENFMDYTNCYRMYTTQQVERMYAALEHPTRKPLWQESNLIATGVYGTLGKRIGLAGAKFNERFMNDGRIDGSGKIICLGGSKFAKQGDLVQGTDYVVENLPQGLSMTITVTDETSASIVLAGQAVQHAKANSVGNMKITFLAPAIEGGLTGLYNTELKNLGIIFNDPYTSYCTPSPNWAVYSHLSNVKLGTIDNTTTYKDYNDFISSMVTNVIKGQKYNLTITTKNTYNTGADINVLRVWADWNHDFIFDPATESLLVQEFPVTSYTGNTLTYTQNFEITIPDNAVLGKTALRIVVHYKQGTEGQDPCGTYDSGECEDYGLNIVPVDAPYMVDFTYSPPTVNFSQKVNFSDVSTAPITNPITKWEWSFPGGVPNTSSNQIPGGVLYPDAGSYSVNLKVTNSNNEEKTITKSNIITSRLEYCTIDTRYCCYAELTNVKIGTIDHPTSDHPRYESFYNTVSTDVNQGQTYPISFTVKGNKNSSDVERIRVWADWNFNSNFEPEELVYERDFPLSELNQDGTKTITSNITVPVNARIDKKVCLRIVLAYKQGEEGTTPCGVIDSGEAVDYGLNIKAGTTPIIADLTFSPTIVNVGDAVTMTDRSSSGEASPINQWEWTFDGGTPANYVGKTPPQITYNTGGTFNITLKVTNDKNQSAEVTKQIVVNNFFMMKDKATYTTCTGHFFDSGGANDTYGKKENRTTTILPGTADKKVRLNFVKFDTEVDNFDVLKIYDGKTTSAPLIGSFYGNTWQKGQSVLPGVITATNDDGALTLTFTSDSWDAGNKGWDAEIYCVNGGVDNEPPTKPVFLPVDKLTQQSYTIAWNPSTDNDMVKEYKLFKDNKLILITRTTSQDLSDLFANETHAFYLKAVDVAGNESENSDVLSVTTSPSTDIEAPTQPIKLLTTSVSENKATLVWTASTDNVAVYHYDIYVNGQFNTFSKNRIYELINLMPGNQYSIYVVARDLAGNSSQPSNTIQIKTPYCASYPKWTAYSSIKNVTISTINNTSGQSSYSDYTKTIATNVCWNATYPISITIDYPSATTTDVNAVKVWVDWNNNGSFDDAGELVVTAENVPLASQRVVNGTITVPQTAETGALRMRVLTAYKPAYDGSSCGQYESGETEDYQLFNLGIDTEKPTAPSSLVASNLTQTALTLTWNASTDNLAVTSYDAFKDGALVGNSTTTSINVTGLTANTDYSFTVKAKDANNNISDASNPLQVKTLPVDVEKPSSPTNLAVTLLTSRTFTLNWNASTDNLGVLSYDIFADGNLLGNSTSTSYDASSMTPGTTYAITVKAKDAAGNVSDPSTPLTVQMLPLDTEKPSKPEGLAVSNISTTGCVLSWNSSTDNVGVVQYKVYKDGTELASTTSTTYNVTGLLSNTTYPFTVKAFDEENNASDPSDVLMVTTLFDGNYCPLTARYSMYSYISRIQLEALDKSSDESPYTYYNAPNPTLERGKSYTLNLTIARGGSDKHMIHIWIDYNNNGVFTDPDELVFSSNDNVMANTPQACQFTVPAGAKVLKTRMRVALAYQSNYPETVGSCNSLCTDTRGFESGEVEDYDVNITEVYSITASVAPANTGSVTGNGNYNHGANVTLTATPETGYTFKDWTENGAQVSTNPTYSFIATASRTLAANFIVSSYTISATVAPANSGTISGTGEYNHGSSVSLTATAETGYTFTNWTENGAQVSTSPTYSFTAAANRTLVANFTPNSYSIAASVAPANSGTISGTGEYNHGSSVSLTATAETGYTFTNWTENGTQVSTSPTYSFTASANRTLVANFTPNSYSIAASVAPVNSGTIAGAGNYNHGSNVSLIATPETGYTFKDWTENGTHVSTNPTYSFTATVNRTLVANFIVSSYTISATVAPANSGSIAGAGVYNHGSSVSLTATAETGYTFKEWTENGTQVSASPTYTFTVTASKTLVANFQNTVGIETNTKGDISLYPNPANTVLYINGLQENVKFAMYDLTGKELINKQITGKQIDISSLVNGIYTIKFFENNKIVTRKFVKQ